MKSVVNTETGCKQPVVRKKNSQFKSHTSNSKPTLGLGVQYMFNELEQTPLIFDATHDSQKIKFLNATQCTAGFQYRV